MRKLRHLDLFSGIGGFSLAARWTGQIETIAFVEIDPFCQKVLKKHWPDVPVYDDIKVFAGEGIGSVDIITGGFPCQDISLAGKGCGLEGDRSGLWGEYARLIRSLRPKYAIVENSAGLLARGMGTVLRDLAQAGYDAEWEVLSAEEIGAPHTRERLYIVAYSNEVNGPKGMGMLQDGQGAIFPLKNRQCVPIWLQAADSFIGMDDGLPAKLYRPRGEALGNSIVPQVVLPILQAIIEIEGGN
jgi:DNA (cytosine-5)-methyltransferase 1